MPISKPQYDSLLKARSGLDTLLAFEEAFDALMGNYADLESTILQTALAAMLFTERDEALDLYVARGLVGRRVLNLLSSARLYRDAYPAHTAKVFGRKSARAVELVRRLSEMKKSSAAYRFVDALRNSAQHTEIPVHGLSFNYKLEEKESNSTSVIPKINPKSLLLDRKFPKDALKEFSPNNKEFPLMPPLRAYVEQLADLHHATRKAFDEKEKEWREAYQVAHKMFLDRFPAERWMLIHAQPSNAESEDEIIHMPLGKYRDYLTKKNRKIRSLSKHFVKWS